MTDPYAWLQRHRLADPPRTTRFGYGSPATVTEIATHLGVTEAAATEALVRAGYTVDDGRVDMQRLHWRLAIGPQARHDTPEHRQNIDRVAEAWTRQIGDAASVGVAAALGGELRAALTAALHPEAVDAAAITRLLRRADGGDRFVFVQVGERPRLYAVRPRLEHYA